VDVCAGDNWESTYIFWPVFFFFSTSSLVFGFGGEFRKPVWTNWQLTWSWAALFALGSYLILSESNAITRIFHIASEQFNYLGRARSKLFSHARQPLNHGGKITNLRVISQHHRS
jgi:hypothetical protein